MVELNKIFLKGISDLNCDKQMNEFLKNVLKYEWTFNENKNRTQSDVLDQYRKFIENSSEGD